jgi:hypothetical protein
MPISPIVLQRRHAELGRIRLGNQVATGNGKTRPNKLAAFRFTSPSEGYIRDLATLYGGDPHPWDNNGVASWEVFTTATAIPVIAVKGGLSQWMETWSGGGCVHRCDGEQSVDGTPCNPQDRQHQDAKPTTRLSVMLPELEAIGVWRMETHGWNAAAEIPAVAELAQYVGDLVPANLHLVERRSVKDGKTSRFVVPVLDLKIGTERLKEIVNARSGGGELPAGPSGPQQAAIGAGPSAAGQDDPYAEVSGLVEAATTLDELAGIWDQARAAQLVGSAAPDSPRLEAFVAAWKAKAHAIKDATQHPAGEDGVVDAEVVDDGDADQIWQQILTTAGSLPSPMALAEVQDDFQGRYGMSAAVASAAELRVYLDELKGLVTA